MVFLELILRRRSKQRLYLRQALLIQVQDVFLFDLVGSRFVLRLIFLYLFHDHFFLGFAGIGHDVAHGHFSLVHALHSLLLATYLLAFKYYLVINIAAKRNVSESPILLIQHFFLFFLIN